MRTVISATFLMPVAVMDRIQVPSEFLDTCHASGGRRKTGTRGSRLLPATPNQTGTFTYAQGLLQILITTNLQPVL